MHNKIALGIHGSDISAHQCDHIAYFWDTPQQFKNAVGFLEEGLRGDDHCVVFGHDEANELVLQTLRERGKNIDKLISANRLSVLGAETSGDATLQKIGKTFQRAIDQGAPLIRLLGNIGWHQPKWPNESDILAFEAQVTTAARSFPCVILCMYDVNALPGKVIMRGGIETHPIIIRGNVVRENPFYVTMEKFLKELEEKNKSA